ncbi:hypothetical protein [Flavilitoribacter nigricans]|nr:hypothetical protein [Flavilitoribacter nigricans]
MKQIYTNAPSGISRISTRTMSVNGQSKGKKIIVDIIGPKKGKK